MDGIADSAKAETTFAKHARCTSNDDLAKRFNSQQFKAHKIGLDIILRPASPIATAKVPNNVAIRRANGGQNAGEPDSLSCIELVGNSEFHVSFAKRSTTIKKSGAMRFGFGIC
jgi:hypothetical protein